MWRFRGKWGSDGGARPGTPLVQGVSTRECVPNPRSFQGKFDVRRGPMKHDVSERKKKGPSQQNPLPRAEAVAGKNNKKGKKVRKMK